MLPVFTDPSSSFVLTIPSSVLEELHLVLCLQYSAFYVYKILPGSVIKELPLCFLFVCLFVCLFLPQRISPRVFTEFFFLSWNLVLCIQNSIYQTAGNGFVWKDFPFSSALWQAPLRGRELWVKFICARKFKLILVANVVRILVTVQLYRLRGGGERTLECSLWIQLYSFPFFIIFLY